LYYYIYHKSTIHSFETLFYIKNVENYKIIEY
jgi:hypothetical protein